jgi:hypothetical protein
VHGANVGVIFAELDLLDRRAEPILGARGLGPSPNLGVEQRAVHVEGRDQILERAGNFFEFRE